MGHITYGYQRNDRDQIIHRSMDSDHLTRHPSDVLNHWWDSPDKVPHLDGRPNERSPEVLNGQTDAHLTEMQRMQKQLSEAQDTINKLVAAQKPEKPGKAA